MKKIVALFFLLAGLAVLPACEEKCGPFTSSYFDVVGLEVKNVAKPDTSWTINQYGFSEADSNSWAKEKFFGINLDSRVTYLALDKTSKPGFGLAFACSPLDPGEKGSKEVIEDIQITSDSIFDGGHPAGASLNDIFRISAVSVHYNSQDANLSSAIPLSEFLNSEQKARRSLQLWLTKNPEISKQHRFTIKYTQTNGEEYIVKAPKAIFQ